jgi:hypothetical protein
MAKRSVRAAAVIDGLRSVSAFTAAAWRRSGA